MDKVRKASFPVVLRGYDRAAVDAYVAEIAQLVAELEATQLPETVVQRALDDVGEETSAILKRAHEAAEEIAARSRSHAEGRLQRADREADLTRRDAEEQAQRLEEDTRAIWQERLRLIEDVRQLADDVLALADDALDRMPPPSMAGEEAEEDAGEPAEADAEPEEVAPAPAGQAGPPGSATGSASGPSEHPSSSDSGDEPPTVEAPAPEDEDTAERPGSGQAGGP